MLSLRPLLLIVVAPAFLFAPIQTAAAQVEYGPKNVPSFLDPAIPPAPTNQILNVTEPDEPTSKRAPYRFGVEVPVQWNLSNSGAWDPTADGGRLWHLRIQSHGALTMNMVFSRFEIPAGAELYLYNDDRSMVLGQYNSNNVKANGQFATQITSGDAVTLEYYLPPTVSKNVTGTLQIGTAVHGYKDVLALLKKTQQQKNSGCETDVNCPLGDPWQGTIINATTLVATGGALCSGSLLNNSASDGTQLYITANHCGNMNNAVFYFNYQKSGCRTGSSPSNQTVQGATQLATSSSIDYRLVRITGNIPSSYNAYYAGWDRSGSYPSGTIAVHHPQGGPKKISFDYNSPSKTGTDWRINQWDVGVTEPGSSGCPLYDDSGHFIGQLWGGAAACGYPYDDYFGRLQSAWSQVSSHLDPTGSGASSIDGYDPNGPSCPTPTGYGSPDTGSNGMQANISYTGTPSVGSAFALTGAGFNGSSFAVMFSGQGIGSNTQTWGTILVTGPGFLRTWTTSNGAGQVSITVPVTAAMVGTTINYQYVGRDPAGPFGDRLQHSAALAVTYCP